MNTNNKSQKHINYIKNIVNDYNTSGLNIQEFCDVRNIKIVNFTKSLNEYLNNFDTVTMEDSLNNVYYIYTQEEYIENQPINKELIGKINIVEYFVDTPLANEEDDRPIDNEILKNKLLIIKIKFTNLQYFSMNNNDIFEKIYIFNDDLKLIKSLNNNSLYFSQYGEVIGYRDTYNRKYLPKISYNVTLAFSIPDTIHMYRIAFKDLYVEGNGIKKITIDISKTKDLSGREKCPNCNSFNTIKDGKRNGKQRYQCNECKRKFSGNKI